MKHFKHLSSTCKIVAIATLIGFIVSHVFIGVGVIQLITNTGLTGDFDISSGPDHVNMTIPLSIRNPSPFPLRLGMNLEIENTTMKILEFSRTIVVNIQHPIHNIIFMFTEDMFRDFFLGWNDTLNVAFSASVTYAIYQFTIRVQMTGVDFS